MVTMESISAARSTCSKASCVAPSGRTYSACSSECFATRGRACDESRIPPRSPYGVAKAAAYWHVANYRASYGLSHARHLFNHESPLRPRVRHAEDRRRACRIARAPASRSCWAISTCRATGLGPEYVEAMWRMLQRMNRATTDRDGTTYPLELRRARVRRRRLDWRRHVRSDPRSRVPPTDDQPGQPAAPPSSLNASSACRTSCSDDRRTASAMALD